MSEESNKEALIIFLCQFWSSFDYSDCTEKLKLYIAYENSCDLLKIDCSDVILSIVNDLACDHEEADTRLLLHAAHASRSFENVIIKSPDTDVAVLFIAHSDKLDGNHIYLAGCKNKTRMLDINKIALSLTPKVASACIGLHVFTGCDTTSAFYGKGKKRAFNIFFQDKYINAFGTLGESFDLPPSLFPTFEEFVSELYGWPGTKSINEARYKSFCIPSLSNQALPPSYDALMLHASRANYQAANHRRALSQFIQAPNPTDHGWQKAGDGVLEIKWMTQKPAPEDVLQTISCFCKTLKCRSMRCSCKRSQLPCTDLCNCVNCSNVTSCGDADAFSSDELNVL